MNRGQIKSLRFVGAFGIALMAVIVSSADYDVIIKGGTVYDGTGSKGRVGDVGIRGDLVAAVGDLAGATADRVLDARGLAVAPGFINMLSWSVDSLILDGRSQGEIREGVTTEIFGEGESMRPYTPAMKIYAPAVCADTKELIELSKVAAQYQGKYISHMRSEGDRFLESVDELIQIARVAKIPAEIYHLKAAGESNWDKLDAAIQKVEAARKEGLKITADMYTYTAGATGFDACLPPWAREGGPDAVFKRLEDPAARTRIAAEMKAKGEDWENICAAAGTPDHILLLEFKSEALKPLQGKTLAEVATMRGQDCPVVVMDLVHEDRTRVGVAFTMMSEDNVRKQLRLPWVSFCSDAASMPTEGVFLKSMTHPRAYGNFSRLLGRYVRDEKLIPLEEAIRRLAGLPAANLGLDRRGLLKVGMFADVVAFDPLTVADKATFAEPHQYSVGMKHVLVNGTPVLVDGEHTDARPGRALYGPGRESVKPATSAVH